MTIEHPPNGKPGDSKGDEILLADWESQVNDLLDGDMNESAAALLKEAAASDHELARAIIEAWELQRGMESLGVERAPASLRRKLKNIPARERNDNLPRRWFTGALGAGAVSFAGAALLAVAILVARPWEPSVAEVEQARQDLRVAFAYLDKINNRTAQQIDGVVATELRDSVTGVISKHVPYGAPTQVEDKS